MITKKHVMLISLLSCILGLSSLASQKHPVERPLKNVGQYHIVISLTDGSYVATGSGHTTLGGRFTSHLEGLAIMTPSGPVFISGFGVVTMANGDQLWFESSPGDSIPITGGTGRFQGASGSATGVIVGDPVVTPDLVNGIVTIDAIQMLEGTVTY